MRIFNFHHYWTEEVQERTERAYFSLIGQKESFSIFFFGIKFLSLVQKSNITKRLVFLLSFTHLLLISYSFLLLSPNMKTHTTMLPSISNLLMDSNDPPTLNLSPASPILLPSTPPHSEKSPRYLTIDQYSISPILSPIDSPRSLPPLQGDDPPQRLRLPSPSPQPTSPVSPKHMLNKWPTPSVSTSSSSSSTTSTASMALASPPLLSVPAPQPPHHVRHRTLSEDLHTHHRQAPPSFGHHHHSHQQHPRFTQSASPSPPPSHHELQVPQQRQRSVSASHEIPSTQIVFDAE